MDLRHRWRELAPKVEAAPDGPLDQDLLKQAVALSRAIGAEGDPALVAEYSEWATKQSLPAARPS